MLRLWCGKFLEIFLFLFFPFSAISQNVTIVGKVLDSETKKPIAGARVQIANSNKGTFSSSSGFFKILNAPSNAELIIRSIGYETRSVDVSLFKDTVIVFLKPSPVKLQEVEKVGEIEADEIIRRAIKKKRDNLQNLKTLQANIYSKLFIELSGALFETSVDTSRGRKIFTARSKPLAKEDSLVTEFAKNFILETFSNVYIDYVDKIKYSEITQRRQTANIPKEVNQIVLSEFLSFYEETIKLGAAEFVTPLADDAFNFYKYELLGKELYGDFYVYKIKVIPNTKLFPTFSGEIKILEKTYNLLELDPVPSQYTSLAFLDSVRFVQKFTTLSENFCQPTYLEMSGKLKLNIINGFFEVGGYFRGVSIVSDAIINKPLPDTIVAKALQRKLVVHPKADSTSEAFWENNALVESSPKEKEIYKKVDTIAKMIDTTLFSLGQNQKKFNYGLDFTDELGYNRVTGYTIGLTPFVEYSRFKLSVSPIYSYSQKSWYFDCSLSTYLARKFGIMESKITLSIFSKPETISLDKNMPKALSNIFSYFFHWDYYDYFKKSGFKIVYDVVNQGKLPVAKLSVGIEHFRHYSLMKKTDKSLFSNATWRENPQILDGYYDVFTLGLSLGTMAEVFGVGISTPNFAYRANIDLLVGRRQNGSPFGILNPKLNLQIPTFYTGYNPMNLEILIEAGVSTPETPPQYSFRMPSAWGFGNFLTAPTGKYGGKRYYALHLRHNFSDLLWRTLGLPTYNGRGLELSTILSLGRFSSYGMWNIYEPTEKWYYEFGIGLARIPTFVSDFLFLGADLKYNPEKRMSKGFGFSLKLSLPF
jgi:hypothetical protein